MPVPATDVQSLDMDHRPAREHLKSSTKEFQPLQTASQLHQMPNLNASMQTHTAWGIRVVRDPCMLTGL